MKDPLDDMKGTYCKECGRLYFKEKPKPSEAPEKGPVETMIEVTEKFQNYGRSSPEKSLEPGV